MLCPDYFACPKRKLENILDGKKVSDYENTYCVTDNHKGCSTYLKREEAKAEIKKRRLIETEKDRVSEYLEKV